MSNKYEEKQQRRRERLERAAEGAAAGADRLATAARDALANIPPGQPILIGHHSERRHRRDVARADRRMVQAVELVSRAEELRERAAAVGTGGISADDPDALDKLRAELEQARGDHARGLALNKAFKAEVGARPAGIEATDRHALHRARLDAIAVACASLELSEDEAAQHRRTIELCPWMSQPYQTSSGSARIRRLEQRIRELEAERAVPADADARHDDLGLTVEDAVDENRIRIRFDYRISDATAASLRGEGWRWAGGVGAWQRQRNQATRNSLERVLAHLRALPKEVIYA